MGAGMLELVEKARVGQWSADEAIDWNQHARRPKWMSRALCGQVISQLLQGERATIQFCQELKDVLPEGAALGCVSYQLADERRHALVLERYLERQKSPVLYSKALSQMHEKIMLSDRPIVVKMIAYHAVLEGEAISLLQDLSAYLSCPLFRRIMRKLTVDEARHLAFGKKFLSENLQNLSPEEKRDAYNWVKDLWIDGAAATLRELSGLGGWVSRRRNLDLERRWARQAMVLRQVGLNSDLSAQRGSAVRSNTGYR
jgi:rubrerythrin